MKVCNTRLIHLRANAAALLAPARVHLYSWCLFDVHVICILQKCAMATAHARCPCWVVQNRSHTLHNHGNLSIQALRNRHPSAVLIRCTDQDFTAEHGYHAACTTERIAGATTQDASASDDTASLIDSSWNKKFATAKKASRSSFTKCISDHVYSSSSTAT